MAKRRVLIQTQFMLRVPTPEALGTLGLLLALAPLLAAPRRYSLARNWLCDGYRTRPGSRPGAR